MKLNEDGEKDLRIEEYCSIKNELAMRVNLLYTHNTSFLVVVVAIWSVVVGLIGSEKLMIPNILEEKAKVLYVLMVYALILSPLLLAYPVANKSGDNLRSVALLSAYVKIFYEIPTCLNDKYDNGIYYEIIRDLRIEKKDLKFRKHFNQDCVVVADISLMMLIVYDCMFLFGIWKTGLNWIAWILFALTSFLAIYLYVLIAKETNYKENFTEYKERYMKRYMKIAQKIGLFSEMEYFSVVEKIQ